MNSAPNWSGSSRPERLFPARGCEMRGAIVPRNVPPRIISVRVFGINRIDRAAPRAMVFRQQLLGRRGAARQAILQHFEVARLVAAVDVAMLAARQPGARPFEGVGGELEHGAAANFGGEALPRHGVAEVLPLVGGPVLDQVPRRVEARVVVKN